MSSYVRYVKNPDQRWGRGEGGIEDVAVIYPAMRGRHHLLPGIPELRSNTNFLFGKMETQSKAGSGPFAVNYAGNGQVLRDRRFHCQARGAQHPNRQENQAAQQNKPLQPIGRGNHGLS